MLLLMIFNVLWTFHGPISDPKPWCKNSKVKWLLHQLPPPFFAAQKKKIPKPKTSAHPKNKESANFFWVGFLDSVKFSDPSKTPQASFHADPHSKQPFVQMPWPWWFPDPNLFYVKTWNHSTETSNKKMAAESSVTRGGKMVATNTFHPGTPADNFDAVDPHEDLKTNGENGRQKKRTFLKLETFGAPNKNGAVKGKTLEIPPQKNGRNGASAPSSN